MTTSVEEIDTEYTQKLLSLIQVEGRLSNNLRQSINDKARYFLDSLTPDAADFLRDDFDAAKHSDEEVRTLIRAVPNCIYHHVSEDSLTLIDSACEGLHYCSQILHLIPLLAEEWISLHGGSYDTREALFYEEGALPNICSFGSRNSSDSANCLNVLDRLREMDLFRKEEIRGSELLWSCMDDICFFANDGGDWRIFKFLADWDPEVMKEWKDDEGKCFIHQVISHTLSSFCFRDVTKHRFFDVLKGVLSVGLLYHLQHFGFLFEKDNDGQSAWDFGCEKHGRHEMWNVVEECIKETGNDEFLVEKCKNAADYPKFSFSPLFITAVSNNFPIKLDIFYHLLKKDPANWSRDFELAPMQNMSSELD